MKIQISRFTPGQNGKVFAILMAIASLVFVIPMMLMFTFLPAVDGRGDPAPAFPLFFFLLFPALYLVFGYLSVAAGCWLYNLMFRFIGGIEYETREGERA